MSEIVRMALIMVLGLLMIAYPVFTWKRRTESVADWFWNALLAVTICLAALITLIFLGM